MVKEVPLTFLSSAVRFSETNGYCKQYMASAKLQSPIKTENLTSFYVLLFPLLFIFLFSFLFLLCLVYDPTFM